MPFGTMGLISLNLKSCLSFASLCPVAAWCWNAKFESCSAKEPIFVMPCSLAMEVPMAVRGQTTGTFEIGKIAVDSLIIS